MFMQLSLMIRTLLVAFGLATIANFVTTMFGMAAIFHTDTVFEYALCATGALSILALKLCFQMYYVKDQLMPYQVLRYVVWLAIILDFYLLWNSIAIHVAGKQPLFDQSSNSSAAWGPTEWPARILSIVFVILLDSAPILFSYFLYEHQTHEEAG
jgi:hypothetical protein